jgi:UDP-N-acetylmuramyl pentapeptide phosphotransferase/UDP-N-acetylglucosamine-1-phosphate transferase
MSGTVLGAVGLAFLVALALVPALVRFAIGRDLLDVPNARSSHEVPTPRLGGVAVIAAVWSTTPFTQGEFYVLFPATLVGFLGVLDDLLDLRAWLKFVGQAGAALVLLFLLPPPILDAAGFLWPVALVFCVFWIVSVVNAYNFMDGIDGIVGGTAILNTLFLMSLLSVSTKAGIGLPALAAAVAGFLMWNISPARIFLGDSGSYFVGFFLGSAALHVDPVGGSSFLAFAIAAAVFTPFLFDTGYTLLRRVWAGKDFLNAHREHIYQRITPDPAKHRQASIIYYALATLCGLAVLFVSQSSPADMLLRLLAGSALIVGCCLAMALLPRVLNERGYI